MGWVADCASGSRGTPTLDGFPVSGLWPGAGVVLVAAADDDEDDDVAIIDERDGMDDDGSVGAASRCWSYVSLLRASVSFASLDGPARGEFPAHGWGRIVMGA